MNKQLSIGKSIEEIIGSSDEEMLQVLKKKKVWWNVTSPEEQVLKTEDKFWRSSEDAKYWRQKNKSWRSKYWRATTDVSLISSLVHHQKIV